MACAGGITLLLLTGVVGGDGNGLPPALELAGWPVLGVLPLTFCRQVLREDGKLPRALMSATDARPRFT